MNSMLAIYFGQIHYSLAITACHAIISCLLFGKHYWAATGLLLLNLLGLFIQVGAITGDVDGLFVLKLSPHL